MHKVVEREQEVVGRKFRTLRETKTRVSIRLLLRAYGRRIGGFCFCVFLLLAVIVNSSLSSWRRWVLSSVPCCVVIVLLVYFVLTLLANKTQHNPLAILSKQK